jgi:hypothetical protein
LLILIKKFYGDSAKYLVVAKLPKKSDIEDWLQFAWSVIFHIYSLVVYISFGVTFLALIVKTFANARFVEDCACLRLRGRGREHHLQTVCVEVATLTNHVAQYLCNEIAKSWVSRS